MTEAARIWLVIGGLALVTVVTRCTLLLLGDRLQIPDRLSHALRHAPICALVALVAPVIFQTGQGLPAMMVRPELAGGVVAVVAMRLTRNMLLTMALGMVAFTLARWP